jgi:glyoxylase-like metal-dependent hydrolase (beta-lactamase superfamily II)
VIPVTDFNLSPCQSGEIIQLSPQVRRITAANPGVLTGPGSNTYLVGNNEVAVIDPGPLDPSHIEAILHAGDNKIRWIVVTHTHEDHSPAAAPLAKATGAQLIGALYPDDGYQDTTFQADLSLQHGQQLQTDEFALEAVHTPGHVGNHFCFLLKEEGMLFTGDHIMEGSTVVIIPPSGDMAEYLASLQLLKQYPVQALAPGHGKLILQPFDYIDSLIRHRLKRERKLVEALRKAGETTLEALLPVVYDDVDKSLHDIAAISLWAHLLKLEKEGMVLQSSRSGTDFHEAPWVLANPGV